MNKRIKSISVRIRDRYDERFLSRKQRERNRYREPKPPVEIEVGKNVPDIVTKGDSINNPVTAIHFLKTHYLVSRLQGGTFEMNFDYSEVIEVTYFDDND